MEAQSFQFKGERSTVRAAAIEQALKGLIHILEK